jgi:hypothetical protein
VKARKVKGLDPEGELGDNARRIVEVRLDELCRLAPSALDPTRPKKLHDMRIAAKRLRYVLEIAQPALGSGAADGSRTAKRLQELLGEIHDCDEMLPRVRRHAAGVRSQDGHDLIRRAGANARDINPELASAAPGIDRYRGLEAVALYLAARREVLFARFTREWGRLEARDFAGSLLTSISAPEQAVQSPTAAGAP